MALALVIENDPATDSSATASASASASASAAATGSTAQAQAQARSRRPGVSARVSMRPSARSAGAGAGGGAVSALMSPANAAAAAVSDTHVHSLQVEDGLQVCGRRRALSVKLGARTHSSASAVSSVSEGSEGVSARVEGSSESEREQRRFTALQMKHNRKAFTARIKTAVIDKKRIYFQV
jgi:hypothetical protein